MSGFDMTGKHEDGVQPMRSEMNGLVRELDRGRRDLVAWPTRLRDNALAIGIGAIGVACVACGVTLFATWRKRRRNALGARIGAFRDTLARMIAS
jgi:hypothetical protein